MSDDDIDPELAKLINDIDQAEASSVDEEIADDTAKVESEEDVQAEEPTVEEIAEKTDELAEEGFPFATDEDMEAVGSESREVIEPEVETDLSLEDDEEDTAFELQKEEMQRKILSMMDKHYDSAGMMFDEAESDRKKIDDIFAILLPKVQADNYKAADINAIAALMQTKSDISRNRASMMDSIAKLFAALKNNDSVGVRASQDADISQKDVEDLLNQKDL